MRTLDFVSPRAEHALDQRVVDEVVHQRRRCAGGEEMSRSPHVSQPRRQAADRRRWRHRARARAGSATSAAAASCASEQQMAARVALAFLERFEDERFLFRPHAAQRADASVGRRALEIVEGADAELAIQRRDRLGSDALEVEEIENRRRKLGERARGDTAASPVSRDLADARGEVLADARNLAQSRARRAPPARCG